MEICEQGTPLICQPKDVWASRKKDSLQSGCARNVGDNKSVITFAPRRKRAGCIQGYLSAFWGPWKAEREPFEMGRSLGRLFMKFPSICFQKQKNRWKETQQGSEISFICTMPSSWLQPALCVSATRPFCFRPSQAHPSPRGF